MWFAIAFIAALFIGLALMPAKRQIEDARVANLGDFNFPRSQYGDVVPIIFGTVKQNAPIVTWFGGFAAFPIQQEVSTGLFSSDTVITGYNYTIALQMALALGPDVKLKQIHVENKLVWGGGVAEAGDETITINMPELYGGQSGGGGIGGLGADKAEFRTGSLTQGPNPYMAGIGVNPLPTLAGVSYIVLGGMYIGTSPNVRPWSFVLKRVTSYLSASYSKIGEDDVNPMEIAWITLTHTWGHLGIDPGEIDMANFQAAAQVLHGEGIGMSMIVSAESTGKAVLEECMRVADGVLYQEPTTGLIKVKLIRQDYSVGSLLTLDESNIIGNLDNLGKTTWEATYNQVRVSFKNRLTEYQESIALLQDESNVNFQNRLKTTTIAMPGVKLPEVAAEMARRQLALISVPLFKCDLKANRIARNLRPGDVFKINWAPYGLTDMVMRVTSVDLGELLNNEVKISCVQDRFAADIPTFAPPGVSGYVPVVNTPQEIVDELVWEPPSFFIGNINLVTSSDLAQYNTHGRFMAQAKPPSAISIGFNIYLGQNSSPTAVAVQQTPYYGKGTLVNAYASTVESVDGVDSTNTFQVSGLDSRTVQGLVNNSTLEAARVGNSMFLIDNELFAFTGLTDLGGGVVQFNTVYRALLDTAMASHSAGAAVWFIRRGSGLVPQLVPIGDDVYLKLTDRTPNGEFPVADATAIYKILSGRAKKPLPPQYVTIDGSRTPPTKVSETSITVAWRRRTRYNPKFRVYNDTSDTTGETLGNVSHRVRWKLGSDPEQSFTVNDSGSFATSYDIDVTGMVGTLVVRVDALDNSNGQYSTIADTISVVLT